jgi:hypothetical protein
MLTCRVPETSSFYSQERCRPDANTRAYAEELHRAGSGLARSRSRSRWQPPAQPRCTRPARPGQSEPPTGHPRSRRETPRLPRPRPERGGQRAKLRRLERDDLVA